MHLEDDFHAELLVQTALVIQQAMNVITFHYKVELDCNTAEQLHDLFSQHSLASSTASQIGYAMAPVTRISETRSYDSCLY